MMFVKCTDASGAYKYLTEGKVYKVLNESDDCYLLDAPDDCQLLDKLKGLWNKGRFEVVSENDKV